MVTVHVICASNGYPRDSNTNRSGRLASILEIGCASSVHTRSCEERAAVLAAVGP